MADVKILAFAGSTREQSFNRKFIRVAVELAKNNGAQVTLVELKDYPLPLYNQDLEEKEGLPENVKKLKEIFFSHDALLISSPEYNSSITPLLKNTIDWVSRKSAKDEESLKAYKNKVTALLSASAGNLGGMRSLITVRSILGNIGVIVLPEQRSLSKADKAFDDQGNLTDPKEKDELEKVVKKLIDTVKKLKG